MLGIGNGSFNSGHIAAQINSSRRGQVRACGGLAGLVNSTVSQFLRSLANCIGSQRSSLLIPLCNGTAPSYHAIVLTQLIFGLRSSSQIRSNDTRSIKGNRSRNAINDAILNDTVVIHQNCNHGYIVLGFTVCICGSRHAIGDTGRNVQTGLQGAFRSRNFRCFCLRRCGSSLLNTHLVTANRTSAFRIIHHRGASAASQHGSQHRNSQKQGYFFHFLLPPQIFCVNLTTDIITAVYLLVKTDLYDKRNFPKQILPHHIFPNSDFITKTAHLPFCKADGQFPYFF